jgi:hypothetical protein
MRTIHLNAMDRGGCNGPIDSTGMKEQTRVGVMAMEIARFRGSTDLLSRFWKRSPSNRYIESLMVRRPVAWSRPSNAPMALGFVDAAKEMPQKDAATISSP